MGQRLCLTTYGAGEKCYNIYVHWGGYTVYGLILARHLIEITTKYCEEKYKSDWEKMTKYDYIEALLNNECGMKINWFDQEFENDKDYPEIAKLCDDLIERDFCSIAKISRAEFASIKNKIFDDANLKAFTKKELVLKEKTFFNLFRNLTDSVEIENTVLIESTVLDDYFSSIFNKENKEECRILKILYSVCTGANRND